MTAVTMVSVGDTANAVIEELAQQHGTVQLVRRCPELAELLAACQSGLAQVAVVAGFAEELTATLVDRLTAVGVSVVAVAASPGEALRLRGIGAAVVAEHVTAEQLGEVVRAAVEGRRHPGSAGYAVPTGRQPDPGHDAGTPPSLEIGASVRTPDGDGAEGDGAGGYRPDGYAADWPKRKSGQRRVGKGRAGPSLPGTDRPERDGPGQGGSGQGSPGKSRARKEPAAAAGVDADGEGGAPAAAARTGAGEPVEAGLNADVRLQAGAGEDIRETRANAEAGTTAQPGAQPGAKAEPNAGLQRWGLHRPGTTGQVRDNAPAPAKSAGMGARLARYLHSNRSEGSNNPPGQFSNRAHGQEQQRAIGVQASGAPGNRAVESGPGTLVTVWGPIGSPGRTTLAINLAAEQAAAGRKVMLIDADCYGASVAAALGLLDESASFAQACRAADQGGLNAAHLARTATQVVFDGGTFSLLTGLTRADRWPELRAAAVDRVLGLARELVELVIVDCGFSLENDEELSYDTVAPRRNAATLMVLAQSDMVYAVGNGDPIGIPRLIRGLDELGRACPGVEVRVVVNKVRRRAVGGNPEKSLVQAWERFGPALGISHFLPWDPELTDKALLEGRLLRELAPDAALSRAIRGIACAPDQRNLRTPVGNATARVDIQG